MVQWGEVNSGNPHLFKALRAISDFPLFKGKNGSTLSIRYLITMPVR